MRMAADRGCGCGSGVDKAVFSLTGWFHTLCTCGADKDVATHRESSDSEWLSQLCP